MVTDPEIYQKYIFLYSKQDATSLNTACTLQIFGRKIGEKNGDYVNAIKSSVWKKLHLFYFVTQHWIDLCKHTDKLDEN